MLDIRFVRENPELVQKVADQKRIEFTVSELLQIDQQRREILQEVEELRYQRNIFSKKVTEYYQQQGATKAKEQHDIKQDAHVVESLKQEVSQINNQLREIEEQFQKVDHQYNQLMLLVPNIVSGDTPIGASDEENVEIRRVGNVPEFDFPLKDHVELGELHDLFDIPRGVKVAGTRNYFLKGIGVQLHRAVQQLAIDLLQERGFTLMDVPVLLREEALFNTGFFPAGQDQTYHIAKDGQWLVGTAEAPLVSYYSDEIIDVSHPIRLAGVSPCFRREAGSAGRDVRGLYRVHQFAKVEQVVICKNDLDEAERLLQEMTQHAEDILQLLELPYRVVQVCTGDMGQKNYKQYDIETWMPSRDSYGETHSSSNVLDFQARRSKIRYRDEDGQLQFCITLNNTAVATPRILIPLLENHQREDGGFYIPKALRKYIQGVEMIKPKIKII